MKVFKLKALRWFKSILPPNKKRKLKSVVFKYKKIYIDLIYGYSYPELVRALKTLGVDAGDALMVHSSFGPFNGFQGPPQEVIKAFKECIGDKGTLLMVSMPYDGSTQKYLKSTKVFHSKKTMSKMGLLSEIFRRNSKVLRSLNPAHPVLASGALAEWFVSGHEKCLYSCGDESPFEKLAKRKGKVLFFDVPFNTFTFIHHIEHLLERYLPFSLYGQEVVEFTVIDFEGKEAVVRSKYFSHETVKRRCPKKLEDELTISGFIKKHKVGNTTLALVHVQDAISCAFEMANKGKYFYD